MQLLKLVRNFIRGPVPDLNGMHGSDGLLSSVTFPAQMYAIRRLAI